MTLGAAARCSGLTPVRHGLGLEVPVGPIVPRIRFAALLPVALETLRDLAPGSSPDLVHLIEIE